MTASIVDLEEAVASLPATARAAAGRILAISTTIGRLEPPPEMHEWIRKFFGSVEAVREQRIVRVSNQVTFEGALFNELRALRPMEVKGGDEVRATIASSANDPFCRPETGTPADVFGRVEGRWGITASNVAKYDGFHGVLVFKDHDPLAPLDAAAVRDHLTTARRWAERALEVDPAARYYLLLWNCLWRAGGSIVHGHMQMTATRGMHYPKIELLRRQALAYDARHGSRGRSLRSVPRASSPTTWPSTCRRCRPTARTGGASRRSRDSWTAATPRTRRATLGRWSCTLPPSSPPTRFGWPKRCAPEC